MGPAGPAVRAAVRGSGPAARGRRLVVLRAPHAVPVAPRAVPAVRRAVRAVRPVARGPVVAPRAVGQARPAASGSAAPSCRPPSAGPAPIVVGVRTVAPVRSATLARAGARVRTATLALAVTLVRTATPVRLAARVPAAPRRPARDVPTRPPGVAPRRRAASGDDAPTPRARCAVPSARARRRPPSRTSS
ncbi:hypothetical protein ATM99_05255 [Cellulomonas sp. B6]|nr:hypothetical protein ATM99_05255 [Cellulomonas sp. B6]